MTSILPDIEPCNYSQIPNVVLDNLHSLTGAEAKVIMTICRATFGWQMGSGRTLSRSYIAKGAGISMSSAFHALESLTTRGWLHRHREDENDSFCYSVRVRTIAKITIGESEPIAKITTPNSKTPIKQGGAITKIAIGQDQPIVKTAIGEGGIAKITTPDAENRGNLGGGIAKIAIGSDLEQEGGVSENRIGGYPKIGYNKESTKKSSTPLTPLAGGKCLKKQKRSKVEADLSGIPIPENLRTPEMSEALEMWREHKRERGEFYKPTGWRCLLAKLAAMGAARAAAAIAHSASSNYAGIFEPTNGHTNGHKHFVAPGNGIAEKWAEELKGRNLGDDDDPELVENRRIRRENEIASELAKAKRLGLDDGKLSASDVISALGLNGKVGVGMNGMRVKH